MSFSRSEVYQDSGVEWLGAVIGTDRIKPMIEALSA
jgi:hypothetical protein